MISTIGLTCKKLKIFSKRDKVSLHLMPQNLFTTQLFAVNKSTLEYVFVEIYNSTRIDMTQLYEKTGWKHYHNIVFCDSDSLFWKNQINKMIDLGYLKWQKQIVDKEESARMNCYLNKGTVPIFNLPEFKNNTEHIDFLIHYIDQLIDS